MNARYLLVDGHSVIFAWADLRTLHQRNRAAARKELEDRLRQLHDSTTWRVTLVLDGTLGGAAPPVSRRGDEMAVIFGSADQTADSIIERIVAGSGVAEQIVVVTADHAEQSLVESLGATTSTPEWLREELARQDAALHERLQHVHRGARWSGKPGQD